MWAMKANRVQDTRPVLEISITKFFQHRNFATVGLSGEQRIFEMFKMNCLNSFFFLRENIGTVVFMGTFANMQQSP